jgi:hypothetical protein
LTRIVWWKSIDPRGWKPVTHVGEKLEQNGRRRVDGRGVELVPVVAEQSEPFTRFYRECVAEIAQRLADLGGLRQGIDAAYANDVLWLYFGYGSLYTLHHENGWTCERAEHWLAAQAARELLAPARAPNVRTGPEGITEG